MSYPEKGLSTVDCAYMNRAATYVSELMACLHRRRVPSRIAKEVIDRRSSAQTPLTPYTNASLFPAPSASPTGCPAPARGFLGSSTAVCLPGQVWGTLGICTAVSGTSGESNGQDGIEELV
jgi:hypothetical protein